MEVLEQIKRVTHPEGGELITKQSHALESDINSIISRFIQDGSVSGQAKTGDYGDFSGVSDYHDALSRIKAAEQQFASLPVAVRRHCDNNAGKFLEMVYNPEKIDELRELGMMNEQVPKPETPAVPETPAPAE